jgi:8-oxo-dGTP diphosphatase
MTNSTSPSADADESAFLAAYDADAFPRPSLAVDVALLTIRDGALHTVLVRRTEHPHRGRYQLPGVFVGVRESLDRAAERALERKAGIAGAYLEQLYSFGRVDRDPRTRVVSVTYYALVPDTTTTTAPGAILARLVVPWEGETGGPVDVSDPAGGRLAVAFDHAEILGATVKRLRGKLGYAPVGFELLPRRFPLRALQHVHEVILGRPLNKDSFRKTILERGWVVPTGEREPGASHRPAELYSAASTDA